MFWAKWVGVQGLARLDVYGFGVQDGFQGVEFRGLAITGCLRVCC